MYFGFALELSDIDLWNIDLLDTHLDLLGTDIPSIFFVSIVSSRRLQDMSSRHLQDISSSRHVFKMLQDMTSRCLQDVLEDINLLSWRYVEYVFKTCLEDVFKTSSRPENVCWEVRGSEFSSKKIELRNHHNVTFWVINSVILIKIKFSS